MACGHINNIGAYNYISNCKELPTEDVCSTVVTTTQYAIGTPEITVNPDDLNDEIRQINELIEFALCGELLNTLNCVVRYPACSVNTEKLIPICESQCLQIDVQIKQCLLNLQESNLPPSEFPLVHNLLNSIDCLEPNTYYNFGRRYIENNLTDCINLSKH